MALALGAKYKADWDSSCTHLICAYKNTPKYNQVKTLGKIVKRHWVEKCHQLKKRLPWRRYALSEVEAGKPESDEEILDESLNISHSLDKGVDQNKTLSLYDKDDSVYISSGEDTEDELDRVRSKPKNKNCSPNQSVVISTDEENDSN